MPHPSAPALAITLWRSLLDTAGRSRSLTWDELRALLGQPHEGRGDAMPGWSPARFAPCVRSSANVRAVSALCLDYDGGATIDDVLERWAPLALCLHTTRRHTPAAHRFRLVLPLSREVTPAEHARLWLHAATLDPRIDPATKDAGRFWYLPGVGTDLLTVRKADGPWLDPDAWLAAPEPAPERPRRVSPPPSGSAVERRARAYVASMPGAISGSGGHQATWAAALALAAGFDLPEDRVYDLLAAEHNPRCRPEWSEPELRRKAQQACAARVEHGYLLEDRAGYGAGYGSAAPRRQPDPPEPERPAPPPTTDDASTDDWPDPSDADAPDAPPPGSPLRLAAAYGVTVGSDAPPEDWTRALALTAQGLPTGEAANAALILAHDEAWRGVVRHDTFADRVVVGECPPLPGLPPDWPSLHRPAAGDLADAHATYAALWLRKKWCRSWSREAVFEALQYAALQHPIHPVREYLAQCRAKWDGVPRVESWIATYLGAAASTPAESVYLSCVGRWFLVGAVARIMRPGAKVDLVLVVEGQQGALKNTALDTLFSPWYLPDLPDLRDKDAMHVLQGYWLACNDELSATRKQDIEKIKSFFSRSEDIYRPPYGRATVRRPRQCVFAATTNADDYLSDDTGNRRWLPVRVGRIRIPDLVAIRDQLWGEAVALYAQGVTWWPDPSVLPAVQIQQAARVHGDPWDDLMAGAVRGLELVTLGGVLGDLGVPAERWSDADARRVARYLRRTGWEQGWEGERTTRRRVWRRSAEPGE